MYGHMINEDKRPFIKQTVSTWREQRPLDMSSCFSVFTANLLDMALSGIVFVFDVPLSGNLAFLHAYLLF